MLWRTRFTVRVFLIWHTHSPDRQTEMCVLQNSISVCNLRVRTENSSSTD